LGAALSFGFALFIWARSFLIRICISFLIGVASAMVASQDSMSSKDRNQRGANLFDGFELLAFEPKNFGG
jgi:hypothetical protein